MKAYQIQERSRQFGQLLFSSPFFLAGRKSLDIRKYDYVEILIKDCYKILEADNISLENAELNEFICFWYMQYQLSPAAPSRLIKKNVACDKTVGHYVQHIITEGNFVTLNCACSCYFQAEFPSNSSQDTYLKELTRLCHYYDINTLYPDEFGQSAVKRLYLEGRSNEKIRNSLPSYNTPTVKLPERMLKRWEKGRLKIAITDIINFPPPMFSRYNTIEEVIQKSIKAIAATKMLEAI